MTPGMKKMSLIKLKKNFSAAADEGWTSNTSLKALVQCSKDKPHECDFHHAIGSVWLDTSSATAKYYVGSSDFRPSISDVESKKGNARSESTSVAVGLRSLI